MIEKHLVGDVRHFDHYEGLDYYDNEMAALLHQGGGSLEALHLAAMEYRDSQRIGEGNVTD